MDDDLCPSDYEDGPPDSSPPEPPAPTPQHRQQTLAGWAGVRAPAPPPAPPGGWLVCDLFASVGGVSAAAVAEGHTVVLAIDMEQWRLDVHSANHPEAAHACLELGPGTDTEVEALIRRAVPDSEWHRCWIHASPPCTCQSGIRNVGKKRSHTNFEALDADQRANHDLVRWTMALLERLEPPQWSLEEVDDSSIKGTGFVLDSGVRGALQAVKRRSRGFVDFDVFQLEQYGVPQARTRLIAGRPATIAQLRHAHQLRVSRPVTAYEALQAAGALPEADVQYILGPLTRRPEPSKVRPAGPHGVLSDGRVRMHDMRAKPCPTLTSKEFAWITREYESRGGMTVAQMLVLMTFPSNFKWVESKKGKTSMKNRRSGVGNAVPPLFMRKVFRAASVLA